MERLSTWLGTEAFPCPKCRKGGVEISAGRVRCLKGPEHDGCGHEMSFAAWVHVLAGDAESYLKELGLTCFRIEMKVAGQWEDQGTQITVPAVAVAGLRYLRAAHGRPVRVLGGRVGTLLKPIYEVNATATCVAWKE